MRIHQAGVLLARLNIGPCEAIALGVIAKMKGEAQSRHVREALEEHSKNPAAVIQVIRKKGLIRPVENPSGFPFWQLTADGVQAILKATDGLPK
jgi:hypothetical protein